MIITRTPFRIPLGGGGTDLPAYYSQHGGFVFSYTIDKYMYLQLTQPIVDNLVRIKYNESETVSDVREVRHQLAREILLRAGVRKAVSVVSTADIPAGTGLGSSASYGVGLLNAIYSAWGENKTKSELAEEAIDIEMNTLGRPIGKQDQYMVAHGGLTVIDIDREGNVNAQKVRASASIVRELESNLMLFYTGVTRGAEGILQKQSTSIEKKSQPVIESMHYIKEIGHKILNAVESENLDEVGTLMNDHWEYKKKISTHMSSPEFDRIYSRAREAGALGGKIVGAGGGGFFVFYVPEKHREFRKKMASEGLKELYYRFDFEGTKVIFDVNNLDRTGKWFAE